MSTISTAAIETRGLTKFYGPHRGVQDLTFSAAPGEVLGFLGPNGSGKTTTIRLLIGFLKPTAGQASVLGRDIVKESREIRMDVGYLPGDVSLYGERTGEELLDFVLKVRQIKDRSTATSVTNLLNADMHRPIKKLSRGMRQKVGLVLTFAHDPQVLVLDEPTSGLDPIAQRALLGLLNNEAKRGKAVFFSSHVLSEAEQICDRVAIIKDGRLVTIDEVSRLREQKFKEVTIVYDGPPPALERLDGAQVTWQHDGRMTFRVRSDIKPLLAVLEGCDLRDLSITEPSLEEVFLDYFTGVSTGHSA